MPTLAFGRNLGVSFCLLTSLVLPQCASAQSLDDLDQLVLGSVKPAEGLTLARSQAAAGSLLDALATLERVLAVDPKDNQAKLLHASLLCRIDDRDGAAAEFDRLRSKDYKKPEWSAALLPCSAAPATGQGGVQ
jgi:Flp pilus assembly protein TadD